MTEIEDRFERFKEEHARLHDPSLLRSAVELVPLELNKFARAVTQDEKKKTKRKIRHGAAAAWTKTKIKGPREVYTGTGEQLLPLDFLKKLAEQTSDNQQSTKPTSPSETQIEMPQIEVDPPSVALTLKLFQELTFTLDAPAAQQVELVWRKEQGSTNNHHQTTRISALSPNANHTELQRVEMEHRRADHFETRIGIADGNYLFGFSVDGHMRTDARFARRVLLNREGLFTPRTLRRHSQIIWITNKSTFAERLQLETNVPWLIPDPTYVDLPGRSSVQTRVSFHPPMMKIGLNEGLVRLSVEREKQAAAVGAVHFSVQAEADGAVPAISFRPTELGELRQGLDQSQLFVKIIAHGQGPLSGMITLPHTGELVDFRLNANSAEEASLAHTFNINSDGLTRPQPHQQEAWLRLQLLTDSFLANYRLCLMEVPYRLIHLKKSLPALSFGVVRLGSTKVMRLDVKRSDNQAVELDVVLPADAASYLEAYAVRPDAYDFRFDTNTLLPGTNVSETVELIDRRSGLRDQVKVLATVVPGSSDSFAQRLVQ
jgi:hypothetical protein